MHLRVAQGLPLTVPLTGSTASYTFGSLLNRARDALPTNTALSTITAPSSADPLPGLIAALSVLVGSLPTCPEARIARVLVSDEART